MTLPLSSLGNGLILG